MDNIKEMSEKKQKPQEQTDQQFHEITLEQNEEMKDEDKTITQF